MRASQRTAVKAQMLSWVLLGAPCFLALVLPLAAREYDQTLAVAAPPSPPQSPVALDAASDNKIITTCAAVVALALLA